MFVILLTNIYKAVLYTMMSLIARTFFVFWYLLLFFTLVRHVPMIGGGIHR